MGTGPGRILDELTAGWKQPSIRQILRDEKAIDRAFDRRSVYIHIYIYIDGISRGIKKVWRDSVARGDGERLFDGKQTPSRVRGRGEGDGTGNSRNFRGDRGNLKEILARLWAWDTVTMGEIEFIKVEREWGIKCSRNTMWEGGGGGERDIQVEDGWNRWSGTVRRILMKFN